MKRKIPRRRKRDSGETDPPLQKAPCLHIYYPPPVLDDRLMRAGYRPRAVVRVEQGVPRKGRVPCSYSGRARGCRLKPAHAEVLHLEIVLEAVPRSLAADARLLDAAEGRGLGGHASGVDADHAIFKRFGNARPA